MNQQYKYKVTYGYNVTATSIDVYAFDIAEAIQIAHKINKAEVGLSRISKVEQYGVETIDNTRR